VAVSGLSGVTAVSAGIDSTCAIHGGGSIACWGRFASSTVPMAVSLGASAAVSVATGRDHACAVDAAGAVWCWGGNGRGQLGDGSTSPSASAQLVRLADRSALGGAVAVVAGSDFSCAQLTGGEVYCWGVDIFFQARTAPQRIVKRLPDQSTASFAVTGRISAGLNHVCGVEPGGFEPSCWGFNPDGQLGDNTTDGRNEAMASSMFGLASIAAGPSHSCGIRASDMICWGTAAMGNGSGPQTLLYPQVAGRPSSLYNIANPVVSAAAGRDHTCVLRSNGDVMCWGSNPYGQLGIGTTTSSLVPASTTAGAAFWR
jgi:alpha-tubulin suppressor-like RCC1 family protein